MRNNSLKGNADPKLHVRKKVAGGATGAMLGAAVAGPIGAVIGGALGTMIGGAAEQGQEIPKRISKRAMGTKVQARAPGGAGRKSSAVSMRAKRSTSSKGSTAAKKGAMPRSKRSATSKKGRSKN